MLRIEVQNGNIEQALKRYKRKVIKSQQLKELRANQDYTKPTIARRKKKLKMMKTQKWLKENGKL
jgi:small subunit ribosomal protein S21